MANKAPQKNGSKASVAKPRKIRYKLDLSAIVYPTLQRRDFSSVYRLSVLMKEEVNPEILQQAVDRAMTRFPYFKVAIHRGLFWRYLETNHRPGPFVKKDVSNPCMPMPFTTNHRYLFRVYYYNRRISFECHHSLADGNGGMVILQTITAEYLRLMGHPVTPGGYVFDIKQKPDKEEYEDAYQRYATSKVRPPRAQERAYRIHGTPEPFYTLNIVDGIMPVSKVKEVAGQYQASITEYLNSVLLYALQKKQEDDQRKKLRPLKLAMPVNLRQFFPSKTLRNFITMVYPSIDPRLGTYTFEEIISQVHHYMRYYINNKFLNGDITTNAATTRNPFIRVVPLFVKDFVVRLFYQRVQDKQSSAGLTNMGKITVPEDMTPFIERFDIYMGQPYSNRTNCAIISFQDTLTVNFASSIKETDVERYFFTKLIEDGIPVTIESNRIN